MPLLLRGGSKNEEYVLLMRTCAASTGRRGWLPGGRSVSCVHVGAEASSSKIKGLALMSLGYTVVAASATEGLAHRTDRGQSTHLVRVVRLPCGNLV
jgi:hypothetical protein